MVPTGGMLVNIVDQCIPYLCSKLHQTLGNNDILLNSLAALVHVHPYKVLGDGQSIQYSGYLDLT